MIREWVTAMEKGGPDVLYTPAAERVAGYEAQLSVPDLDPKMKERLERNKVGVPAGGDLQVNVEAKNAELAHPKHFMIQVLDASGKEIARAKGGDQEPHRFQGEKPWKGMLFLDIKRPWTGQLTVKVYDSFTRKMWTYTVAEGTRALTKEEQKKDPFRKE